MEKQETPEENGTMKKRDKTINVPSRNCQHSNGFRPRKGDRMGKVRCNNCGKEMSESTAFKRLRLRSQERLARDSGKPTRSRKRDQDKVA